MAYGRPGAIVARLPEHENNWPRFMSTYRATHVVMVPESVETIASSASSSFSACATTCGFIGTSSRCERVSSSSRHAVMPVCAASRNDRSSRRSEEHTSELQSHHDLVCRLLLEKKKKNKYIL